MDEILHSPKARAEQRSNVTGNPSRAADAACAEESKAGEALWTRLLGRARAWNRQRAARKTRRIETHALHPIRTSLAFLGISAMVGVGSIVTAFYSPCYSLSVNDSDIGYVPSLAVYTRVAEQVEGQVSRAMGQTFSLESAAALQFTLAEKEQVMDDETLSQRLFATVPAVTQAYELSVDGIPVGVAADKATLDSALNTLKSWFVSENTISVSFPNEVRVTHKYVPTASLARTQDELVYTLAAAPQQTVPGDSGVSAAALRAPLATEAWVATPVANTAAPTTTEVAPLLSVRVVDSVSYTVPIPAPVVEQSDDSLYIGDRVIRTQGVDGEALIRADVIKLNGAEQARDIISTETVREATATVVAVGTKERPATAPTGVFQWPCQGRITSPFGPRYIFGSTSFHSGIDIANGYGTPLMAADGGVVTFVGSKGSYGNLVIVDHGNGFETYYAHCQTTLVTVGEAVYQGQTIAEMGATGRATGSHCHFEVRYSGEAYDPMLYLP